MDRQYSDFQASCNGQPKSVERHLHTLMCSVSVVTVVFIYTMEDDQRLNTLVHEGDALRFSVYYCKKPENRCTACPCCNVPTTYLLFHGAQLCSGFGVIFCLLYNIVAKVLLLTVFSLCVYVSLLQPACR